MIDIKNITLSRLFVFADVGDGPKWYSYPMLLPPGGFKPKKMHAGDAKPVTAVLPGNSLQVFSVTLPNGNVDFVAPALNFAPILQQSANGHRRERTNVRVRPQESSLFQPPSEAPVVECPQPAGIVWKDPNLAEAPKNYAPCGTENRGRPKNHDQVSR